MDDLLIRSNKKHIHGIASIIYSNFEKNYDNPTYLKERAIITITNEVVDEINMYLLSLVLEEEKIYLSSDIICKMSIDAAC